MTTTGPSVDRDPGGWHRLSHDGLVRTFRLLPLGSGAAPLVIALHGGLQSVDGLVQMSNLDIEAHRSGFAVVYPVGEQRTWNAGRCCGPAQRTGVDDVGFVSALIDRLVGDGVADPARVYVTGISNGGMLAYRVAIECAGRIAAIAPVAASMVTDGQPGVPVSVLHIHGTRDRMVPFGGGIGERSLTRVANPPVREVIDRWRAFVGATRGPSVTQAPPATIETWSSAEGTEISLCSIERGGHVWPGPHARFRSAASAFDATPFILGFFARHTAA